MNWIHRSAFVRQLVYLPIIALLLVPTAIAQLTGTVDFTSTKQQIDGFAVAATFGRGWLIQSASGTIPNQIADQLFNPVTGAGVTMLRLGIDDVISGAPASNGTAANSGILIVNTPPATCSDTPAYTWDHSAGGEIWLSQQAVKYGVKRFYADSWGAPAYMKTNNNLVSGGVICDDTSSTNTTTQCKKVGDCRAAYANYLVQFTKDYLSDGVPVSDLGWINEPNSSTSSYASMSPTSAQSIHFMEAYGPIARGSGLPVNITCCDVYDWTTANNYDIPITTSDANPYVDIYTAHEYGQVANFVLTTGTPTKKNWMTEWGPQSPAGWNPLWDGPYSGTSRNYNDGMFVANDIANALNKGQISAYLYWFAASTSTTGAMIQIGASYQATSYIVPGRLYALAHFSRFVHPGAYQVSMSTNTPNCTTITQGVGNCLITNSFVNPDGTKVINVVNNYTTAQSLSLTLDAGSSDWVPTAYVTDSNTVPNSIYPPTTTSPGSYPPEPTNTAIAVTPGIATVSGTTLSATFTPRSMTTITLAPPVVAGTVQLILTPTLFAEGDGTFLGTLTIKNQGTGTAQNVQLSSGTLGSVAGSTLPTAPLPYAVGNIAPGSSAVVYVNFPAGPTPGSTVVEKYAGTYSSSGGNSNFGGSFRALVPSLPSN